MSDEPILFHNETVLPRLPDASRARGVYQLRVRIKSALQERALLKMAWNPGMSSSETDAGP